MSSTDLCNIPYPNENDDPWYETFEGTMDTIDQNTFAVLQTANNIIIPPSNILWNASSGQLTWDSDFVMPILNSGFNLLIRYGPDQATRLLQLNDGDIVIVTSPYTSAQNIVANFSVISGGKAKFANGLFVFGMRYGTRFVAKIPQVFM